MSSIRKIARTNHRGMPQEVFDERFKTRPNCPNILFSNENLDEYAGLRDSYVEHLQPADPVEMDLVMDMVNAKWQQRRLNNTETEMFEQQLGEQKEELDEGYESYTEIFAQTYACQQLSESVSLQPLHRTLSRLERTYSRALNDLLRLRRPSPPPLHQKMKNEPNPTTGHRPSITNHISVPSRSHLFRQPKQEIPIHPEGFNEVFQNKL